MLFWSFLAVISLWFELILDVFWDVFVEVLWMLIGMDTGPF